MENFILIFTTLIFLSYLQKRFFILEKIIKFLLKGHPSENKSVKNISSLDEKYEAIFWLTNNSNPTPLATNRFGPTSEAIKFVKELYSLGAEKVYIKKESILDEESRIKKEGGPYADTLTVILPKEKEKRKKLLSIYKRELENEGLLESQEVKDNGMRALEFWWD